MAGKQKIAQQHIIAPHYHEVLEEFRRLKGKLAAIMAASFRPRGLEIIDGKAALKIWEQSLRTRTKRLPALLRSFATIMLARSRPPRPLCPQRALIPLEQEVNRLIALHRQLWLQPFAPHFQEGQMLLSRCIEKIAADLQDLFTFFITVVELSTGKVGSRPNTHVWDKEINCRVELAAYKGWAENMGGACGFSLEKGYQKFSCVVQSIMGKRRAGHVFESRRRWHSRIERTVIA